MFYVEMRVGRLVPVFVCAACDEVIRERHGALALYHVPSDGERTRQDVYYTHATEACRAAVEGVFEGWGDGQYAWRYLTTFLFEMMDGVGMTGEDLVLEWSFERGREREIEVRDRDREMVVRRGRSKKRARKRVKG